MTGLFVVSVIIVIAVALKIERKKTRHEVLATVLFSLNLNFLTDTFLDFKYHLYWYFDKQQIDWLYLLVIVGEAAILVIIFNYFPLYSGTLKIFFYIVGWTCILVLFELYVVLIKILHYGDWNTFYSAMIYFVSLYILYMILRFTSDRRENNRN